MREDDDDDEYERGLVGVLKRFFHFFFLFLFLLTLPLAMARKYILTHEWTFSSLF